jgi:glycine oxidase
MRVLETFLKKKGVRILRATGRARLAVRQNRIEGVRLEGRLFKSAAVILASGAWAGKKGSTEIRLPVSPVRGQILVVQKGKNKISTILHSVDGGYIVPWDPENLLLGSTVEFAGFNPVTTAKGLKSIRQRTEKIAPCLKGAEIQTVWAGLRPFPKGRLPIIGPGPFKGLYLAGGYYRSGILISGLAGRLLAKGIVTGKMPRALEPFSYE